MKKNGFTLLEVAVVVLIMTFLVGGSVELANNFMLQSRIKVTEQKLEVIQNALDIYALQNRRLPKPTANDIFILGGNDAFRGGIPYLDLNLPPDAAYDGWKTKFTYIVYEGVTNFPTFGTAHDIDKILPDQELLTVFSDDSNNEITKKAIYVVISHGKNRKGGFNALSNNQLPTTSATIGEFRNMPNLIVGNNNFASYSTNIRSSFDDIVVFKNRMQLIRDIGLEDMSCYISSTIINNLVTSKSLTMAEPFISPQDSFLNYNDFIEGKSIKGDFYQIKCFKYGRLGIYKK